MKKFSANKLKKHNFYFIILMIIISLAPIARVMYMTNQAKESLPFKQDNILRVSISGTKGSLEEDYKISSDTIKKINTQLTNNKKEVIYEASFVIPDNKVEIHIFLDELLEFKDENSVSYKSAKRTIGIIPKDDDHVYVSITIRYANDSKKYITELFSIKSNWLTQYLVDVRSEF